MRHLSSFSLILVFTLGCRKATPPEVATSEPVAMVAASPSVPAGVLDELTQQFEKVRFELDSATLSEGSMAALTSNATILQRHPRIRIEVEGHADERGTSDYNLALGDRRARSVKEHLTKMGVAADRIRIVSFGEEAPETAGDTEAAWSVNRRCEFRILVPDAGVKGTIER